MGDQALLFPGNRGCGKRDQPAGVVIIPDDGRRVGYQDLRTASLQSGEHMTFRGRCVVVRINGMQTKPNNGVRFTSKGGAMAQASDIRKQRARVRLEILAALGINATYEHKVTTRVGKTYVTNVVTSGCHKPAPTRIALTRLSSGKGLDKGGLWEAMKAVVDGIADAFGLVDDRELQENAEMKNGKCARKSSGVVIELFFEVGR